MRRSPLILLNDSGRSPLRLLENVTAAGSRGPRSPSVYHPPRPSPREPRAPSGQLTRSESPGLDNYDPERHHVAVTLSPASKHRLLNTVQPHHENPQADHVTLVPPGQPLTDEHRKMLSKHIGKQVSFHATHHASDPSTQAVRIRGLDHLSDKPHKHVTISTGHGVSASRSNDLLHKTQGERMPNWVPLSGTVHVVDRLAR